MMCRLLRSGSSLTFALACLAVLAAAGSAGAQTVTGTLQGTVTDSSGAVLPGVTITIRNADTGGVREVVTNEVGFYSAPYLAIGRYTVTAKLDGFQTVVREAVQVSLNDIVDPPCPEDYNPCVSFGRSGEPVRYYLMEDNGLRLIHKTPCKLMNKQQQCGD